jgi:hypothetical protein
LANSYFRLFDELYETYNNKETRILLAPRGGVMIHMHLLQSPVHKAYGLRRHGKPTVFWTPCAL